MAALYEYLTKLSERLIKLPKKLMQLPDELISLRRKKSEIYDRWLCYLSIY